MITCSVRYLIDPYKTTEFEEYAKMWIPLVEKFGGIHHGYFLPSEGANNIALALFSFDSLSAYEAYRQKSMADQDCMSAFDYAEKTRCVLSVERSFMRPLLSDKN
ncbi:MAG: NIPSNAP family protein [Alphaproteobacteria bacterium]|nr:NIPSNAP family protein [Alphaproteobacteria bacterium]